MPSKKIVKKYLDAWQHSLDTDSLRECLSEDFSLDSGTVRLESAENFLEFMQDTYTVWEDIKIISELYSDNRASILYEGYQPERRTIMRVAEFIELEDGKIKSVQCVICSP